MKIQKVSSNEKGVVFVTVLIITIVMMIVTVSLLSVNVSQVKTSQAEIQRIKAEVYAQGMVSYFQAQQQVAHDNSITMPTISMGDARDFSVTAENNAISLTRINDANEIIISVDY